MSGSLRDQLLALGLGKNVEPPREEKRGERDRNRPSRDSRGAGAPSRDARGPGGGASSRDQRGANNNPNNAGAREQRSANPNANARDQRGANNNAPSRDQRGNNRGAPSANAGGKPHANSGAPGNPSRPTRPGRPQHSGAPKPANGEPDLAQAYAARARTEREEREKAERAAAELAREKKARKEKLQQLLDGKALNVATADQARHFPHGDKIRRVYVTAEQLPQLNKGELGVVQWSGRYLLVAREIALAAQVIQPESLLLLPDPNAPVDDDIPPDLVW
jgi:hypothetical protein